MESFLLIGVIVAIIFYAVVIVNAICHITTSDLLTFDILDYDGWNGEESTAMFVVLIGFLISILVIFVWPAIIFTAFVASIASFIKNKRSDKMSGQ